MRRRILGMAVALALVAIPGAVAAQACVGIPVGESLNAATAQVGFPKDGNVYGAALRHNLAGPFSLSASYSLAAYDNVDPKQHSFGGEVNYEVAGLPISACPTVGLGYSRMAEGDVTLSAVSVPVGVAFGHPIAVSPRLSVIPHVAPQWVWTRATVDVAGDAVSEDDSVLAALFGATLAAPRFYVGGGVTWIDEQDVDPVFAIFAGLPF